MIKMIICKRSTCIHIAILSDCKAVGVANAQTNQAEVAYNDYMEYSCHTGYTHLSGSLMRKCSDNGILNGAAPKCVRKYWLYSCSLKAHYRYSFK